MPKTENVEVNVLELTKWGFKDNKGFVSLSKNLPESDKSKLVPGLSFTGEYYVADSGTRYLNKILSKVETPIPQNLMQPTKVQADTERAKKFTPKFNKAAAPDNSMSKDEWAAKDRRISRQGCIQVAVQVVSDFDQAAELADKMLAYVNS